MLKVVIDTNVMLSAMLKATGKPRQLMDYVGSSRFALFYPKALISELKKAPSKPRLATKLTADRVDRFTDLIERKGRLVTPECIPAISRDPKDDIFLACAQACNADYLVTGDKDLLCLKQHGGTQILLPAEFLEILATKNQI